MVINKLDSELRRLRDDVELQERKDLYVVFQNMRTLSMMDGTSFDEFAKKFPKEIASIFEEARTTEARHCKKKLQESLNMILTITGSKAMLTQKEALESIEHLLDGYEHETELLDVADLTKWAALKLWGYAAEKQFAKNNKVWGSLARILMHVA